MTTATLYVSPRHASLHIDAGTEADAEALAAQFPKSYRAQVVTTSGINPETGARETRGGVRIQADLKPTAENPANEAGTRRLIRAITKAIGLGVVVTRAESVTDESAALFGIA